MGPARRPRPMLAMRKVLVEALRQATGKSSKRGLGLQWADPNFDMPVAELGIDSLHWIAWCMEIEARTGIEIDPDDIMGVASIGELARLVGERGNGTAAARAPRSLRQAPRDRPLPLSFAQERVWKHHRSNPTAFVSGPSDHIVGPLDVGDVSRLPRHDCEAPRDPAHHVRHGGRRAGAGGPSCGAGAIACDPPFAFGQR